MSVDIVDKKEGLEEKIESKLKIFSPESNITPDNMYFSKTKYGAARQFVSNVFYMNLETINTPNPDFKPKPTDRLIAPFVDRIEFPLLILTSTVLAIPMYLGALYLLNYSEEHKGYYM